MNIILRIICLSKKDDEDKSRGLPMVDEMRPFGGVCSVFVMILAGTWTTLLARSET